MGPEEHTVVVGHANPDFDAYASTVAATKLFPGARGVFLGTQNANVRDFHALHSEFLEFADLKGLDLSSIERLVMVDTRDPGRIGELGAVALDPGVEVVIYDHHPRMAGDIERGEDLSRPVGATSSILAHEIRDRGVPLTPLEASVLLLGVHEDTGSLTFPGSTAYDADAAAFLMAEGADMEVVNQFLNRTLNAEQRDLLEKLTASLEIWDIHGRRVAVGTAKVDQYVDSAGVVTHYVVEDLGHRVAVAVVDMPQRTQIVGRSRLHEVDIGAVLERLGGGGHAQAASAALRGTDAAHVLPRLREALEAEVRPPLTAADIASSPVRTITLATTMRAAGELMLRWGHGALPVLDGDVVAGLVTRKDVDRAIRHGLGHAPVKGFMASEIVTARPSTDLESLERLLTSENIGRIPVLDGGRLVGIVTRKDVLRAEHGDAYLDRGFPEARGEATRRFLESVDALLPEEVRAAVREIGALAEDEGVRAYVVGGFVRDMLLGRPNVDVDVVVEGDGIAFADLAARRLGGRVKAHMRFGTAVLVLSRSLHLDVTSARSEYYTRPGALPTVERSSLRQDLLRRDFSINAMAASIEPAEFGEIADPFGGLRDLRRGVIRALHSLSFVEDPTRIMRAARFERRFGFAMEPSTAELARHAVGMGLLGDISGARLRQELFAILAEEPARSPLERLYELGALAMLLPDGADTKAALRDVAACEEALAEAAWCLERSPRRVTALLAALAGRCEPKAVEHWVRWLRVGRENARAPVQLSERAPHLLRVLGSAAAMRDSRLHGVLAGLDPETLVYLRARGGVHVRTRIDRYVTLLAPVKLEVTGDDLTSMGAQPSHAYSAILAQVLADRLDGVVAGRDAELADLKRLAIRAGLIQEV